MSTAQLPAEQVSAVRYVSAFVQEIPMVVGRFRGIHSSVQACFQQPARGKLRKDSIRKYN